MRLALLLIPVCLYAAVSADQLYHDGEKAERSGDLTRAYLLYSEAAATDPGNTKYWSKASALRPVVILQDSGKVTVDDKGVAKANLNPDLVGKISEAELLEARKPLPPGTFTTPAGSKDFDVRGDAKAVIEQVMKGLGIRVLFDQSYQPSPNVRFKVDGIQGSDALRALGAATESLFIPVSDTLAFVTNDLPQKRAEFEPTAAVVIPVPEPITVQEVQEIITAVRGVMDIQRMLVDTQRRLVLVRDRASKVRIAQVLFEDLMAGRPQVAVEVQILATDRSSSLHYGLSLPTSFPLIWAGLGAANLLRIFPSGFTNFLGFGGGSSRLGVGVTSASLFATLMKSESKTLLDSEVVSLDGQAVTFHVGERYPIATNLYIGNTTASSNVYTPPPTFSFEDLGLLLKMTPHVNGTEGVSLDIDAEFKLLGAASIDGIPVLQNRKYESKVSVREGEWAVLAGLIDEQEAKSLTGLPGLMSIPFLHETTRTRDRSETLIVLKPHVISAPPPSVSREAWVGTESKPRSF